MSKKCGLFIVLIGLICNPGLYAQHNLDFSRYVATGDSLTAGYQNDQLIASGQQSGYANLIATQAKDSHFTLPLVPGTGYPQITYEDGFAVPTGLTPVVWPKQQNYDIAVPGFLLSDFVTYQPACNPDPNNAIDVMAAGILNPKCSSNPGPTELEEAVSLHPSTAIMWIGSNDALYPIILGGTPTNSIEFGALYGAAILAMRAASGNLVVANIPDVTKLPYLISVSELASLLYTIPKNVESTFDLGPNDMVTFYALQTILACPENTSCPITNTPGQPPLVLTAATLTSIRTAVQQYNAFIAWEAAITGSVLVDIYSLVNNLAAQGACVNGQSLTTAFGGGLFSGDGVHPTNIGYEIIANQFISTINNFQDGNHKIQAIPTFSFALGKCH